MFEARLVTVAVKPEGTDAPKCCVVRAQWQDGPIRLSRDQVAVITAYAKVTGLEINDLMTYRDEQAMDFFTVYYRGRPVGSAYIVS